jgi:hypothetical protein
MGNDSLLIGVGAFDSSEPLDEAFQIFIADVSPAGFHLNSDDSPFIEAMSGIHDVIQTVTGDTRSVQNEGGFWIREEDCDLGRNIASWKWFLCGAEFRDQPIEKQTAILI